MTLMEMDTNDLIALGVRLDRNQKKLRSDMTMLKGELERRGQKIMDDLNTHYVKFFGEEGKASVTDSSKLDILNPDKLKLLIGEGVHKTKIKENVKKEYKADTKFERALKAIFQYDYTFEQSLDEFLQTLDPKPDTAQQKLLLKKLKGDYDKDREVLLSVLQLPKDTDLDVELYYIYKIKNAELIKAFLPEEGIDVTMEEIRKCILLDSKMAVAIDYDEDKEEVVG